MGFGWFFIGMLFLANPNVNLIDILPDFVGFGIIWMAMSRIRDLTPDMATARKRFGGLFWLGLSKLLVQIWLAVYTTDSGFLMVFSFCYSIAEIVFYIMAFNGFFDAILLLGTLYGGENAMQDLGGMKRFAVVFIAARCILTALPELSYLYVEPGEGYILGPFVGAAVMFSVLIQLVLGVVFFVKVLKYRREVLGDGELIDGIQKHYKENVLTDRNLFVRRGLLDGLFFVGAVPLLSTAVCFDGKTVFPIALAGVAVLFSLYFWRRYVKGLVLPLVFSVLYVAAALVQRSYASGFADKYYFLGISHSVEAYDMFIRYTVLSCLCAALLIGTTVALALVLMKILNEHGGTVPEYELESVVRREREKKKLVKRQCVLWAVTAVLASVSGAVAAACLYLWQSYWMIDLAVHFIWFAVSIKLISGIKESVESRYL